MSEDDDKFLARWAARKQRARSEAPETPAPPAEGSLEQAPPEETPEEAQERLGLPDIESLEDGSDFSQFMAEGVPEVLRRRALRRLWRLNPIYANLDGLAEYDEDFRDAGLLADGVKTLYKVGKGMFDKQEEAATPAPKVAEEPDGPNEADEAAGEGAGAPDAAPGQVASDVPPEAPSADPLPAAAPAKEAEAAPAEPTATNARPSPSAARRRWGDSEA